MATEDQLIASVRRAVADFQGDQTYDNEYYEDALTFSLRKLSFDFGDQYSTVPDVPSERVFLLEKIATIKMCYIRAAEGAEGESGEGDATRYTTIAVPDLSVTDNSAQDSRGAAFWMKLASDLQKEYDEEVGSKAGQNSGGDVEQGTVRRISLTNGGYRKRVLDPGPDAVTASSVVDGNDVLITWNILFFETFQQYEVYRDTNLTMKTEKRVFIQSDNHVVEFVDESLAAGTFFYRVATRNRNDLRTNSATITVVVP